MTKISSDKKRSRFGCGLVILGIVMLAVLIVGGIFTDNEIHQQSYNEAQNAVRSADIEINMGVGSLEITSLEDSSDLFHADISYIGELDYTVSGSETRQISLNQTRNNYGFDSLFFGNLFTLNNQDDLLWAVKLSPNVPLELDIEIGVGDLELDLHELHILDIQLKMGVGHTALILPPPQQSYRVIIESGVGDTTIILPQGAAVRFESEMGLGDVQFPTRLERVDGNDEQGIWETSNFAAADVQITIIFTDGVGNLTVR